MPPVDVAMARSLHGGLWGAMKYTLARSIAAETVARDIITDAQDQVSQIEQAFSSWSNCMSYAYCKWPVIAAIAIGGIIVLSILICIMRCACFGLSCCCSCFHCLKCCGNCCGCCDPPGGKPHKYLDEPYNPSKQQGSGYRQQDPMEAHFPPPPSGPYDSHGPPQYAEFDVSKKDEPDALPAMPSWEGSNSKHIALEEEGVEMDNLKKKAPSPEQRTSPMPAPMSGAATPVPMGRNSPYDHPQANSTGYVDAYGQQHPANARGGPGQGYDNPQGGTAGYMNDYGQHPIQHPANAYGGPGEGYDHPQGGSTGYANDYGQHPGQYSTNAHGAPGQGYDHPQGGSAGYVDAYGQQHPTNAYGGPGQGYDHPQDGYGQHPANAHGGPGQGYDHNSNLVSDGYGLDQPYDAPSTAVMPSMPSMGHERQSPPPALNAYGAAAAHMQPASHDIDSQSNFPATSSPAPYGMEPHMRNSPGPSQNARRSPGPQNAYAPKPVPFRSYPSTTQNDQPHINNNAGFDFGSSYSRPQDDPSYNRQPSGSREPEGQEAYPGFKPFQAQQGWS